MIRRNHIEKVTRIDRRPQKYEERQSYRQSNSKRYTAAKQLDVAIDDSNRVTSSNKKYHQYKDWKQQNRNKLVSKQLQENKINRQAPTQFFSHEQQPINNLKRKYQISQDQNKYESNTSTSRYQPNKNTENTNISNQQTNYTYTRSNPQEIQDQQPVLRAKYDSSNFQGVQIQKQENKRSPEKRTTNHQSSQKYQQSKYTSNSKSYVPLFDYVSSQYQQLPKKQRRSQVRSTVKNTGKIMYYENSMRSGKQVPTFRGTNINTFNLPPSSQRNTNYQSSICSSVLPVRQEVVQNGSQQVSSKLKKISQFNDQINQRIKNIIVCFESLKSKL